MGSLGATLVILARLVAQYIETALRYEKAQGSAWGRGNLEITEDGLAEINHRRSKIGIPGSQSAKARFYAIAPQLLPTPISDSVEPPYKP